MNKVFSWKLPDPGSRIGTIIDRVTAQDQPPTGVIIPMAGNTPKPLIPGGQLTNHRNLGEITVRVFRGAEATNALELTRHDNALAARLDQRRGRAIR